MLAFAIHGSLQLYHPNDSKQDPNSNNPTFTISPTIFSSSEKALSPTEKNLLN
ncbi:hypothetical protein RvY_03205 [Ramazzottius varieornatus]|uniref:Uncharacterized protein n=1 Tax=Ramazzottius varieornatus TaxID=947166 RepID=A0A1D1UWN6_RAMVA|nr:hypothetical protein RvY_03205 [Ramazzottius varieornatus]